MRRLGVVVLLLLGAAPSWAGGYREREVRDATVEAGFASIANRVVQVSHPTFLVQRTVVDRMPRQLGTSRLGGRPDLPAGTRWPRCAGRTQTFLGQLRLRDLPRAADPLRAHGGLLLVFTHIEFEDPSETVVGLDGGRCTRVIHVPAGRALRRTPPPQDAVVQRLRPARIRFAARPDVPDVHMNFARLNHPLGDVALGDEQIDAWQRMRRGLRRRPGILEHRMLGHLDSPNGPNRCWERANRRTGAWRHLFTMGYDPRVGFEVADGGRLQIAIAPSDLRRGRFDRVCGVFDSA